MSYVNLGEVCDFQGGTQPPKAEWKSKLEKGYIRMLQIRDFTQQQDRHIEYVKDSGKLKKCNSDDILIGRYGASVGKILTGLQGAYNVAIIKTVPDNKRLNKKYLYYFFLNPRFQNFIKNIGGRAAQQGFNKEDIYDYKIFLPPLPDQLHIANLLSKAESLISQRKESIRLLDEYLKSTFLEMFGDPVRNERVWETVFLGEVCLKIGSGSTPRGGKESYHKDGISLIRSLNVHNNEFIYKDLAFIDEAQAHDLRNVIVEPNDVLLNITGASVARCCIIPREILHARVNQHVSILRPDTKILNPFFLSRMLTAKSYQVKLIKNAKSKGATREAITKEELEQMKVIAPPIDLQNRFAQIVEQAEAQKIRYKRSLEELERLYGSLSQRSFRGEMEMRQ